MADDLGRATTTGAAAARGKSVVAHTQQHQRVQPEPRAASPALETLGVLQGGQLRVTHPSSMHATELCSLTFTMNTPVQERAMFFRREEAGSLRPCWNHFCACLAEARRPLQTPSSVTPSRVTPWRLLHTPVKSAVKTPRKETHRHGLHAGPVQVRHGAQEVALPQPDVDVVDLVDGSVKVISREAPPVISIRVFVAHDIWRQTTTPQRRESKLQGAK